MNKTWNPTTALTEFLLRPPPEESPNADDEVPEPLTVEEGDDVWTDHLYLLHQRLSRINSRLRHYNLIAPVHLQVRVSKVF